MANQRRAEENKEAVKGEKQAQKEACKQRKAVEKETASQRSQVRHQSTPAILEENGRGDESAANISEVGGILIHLGQGDRQPESAADSARCSAVDRAKHGDGRGRVGHGAGHGARHGRAGRAAECDGPSRGGGGQGTGHGAGCSGHNGR